MQNSSKLTFTIRGKDDADCFKAEAAPEERIIRPANGANFDEEGLSVTIPAGVIYEPTIFTSSVAEVTTELPSSVKIYSKNYSIMDVNTPLQSNIEISIAAEIPQSEQRHVMMVTTGRSGRASVVNATYSNGKVTAKSRTTGSFFVAVDDVAPSITPSFVEGDTLTAASKISFKVADNYSGLDSYTAKIDGVWIALDLDGSQLTHHFRSVPDGELHEIVVSVTDRCKNSTTITQTFRR